MAEVVLGIGSSHGPLLSTPPEQWDLRAKADRENKNHWFRGKTYDYPALLEARRPGFAHEIVVEKRRERFRQCRSALEALGRKFNEVAPDAVVIIGNDQREFFNPGLTPAITVYRGKTISNVQHLNEDAPGLNIAEPANSPTEGATYPGATEFADHILRSLADEDFDLAQSDQTPSGAPRGGIPHAYGFFYHTILHDQTPPSVPIILNVHFPHNTPKVHRCLELGRALSRAITSFGGFERVALMASGGLTHFVIDEDFDRQVIAAMVSGDEDALAKLPESHFKVGTAEIKNWYPVIAAMNAAGLKYHQIDYVPCYRSEAGTGNAMCFAYWQ
jgi:aromatic ring-opening dioxygenase catalytic subunit (LigB family)